MWWVPTISRKGIQSYYYTPSTKYKVQTDGSLFKMPVQVAIHPATGLTDHQKIAVNEKKNEFIIPLDAATQKVLLDPNNWVLMEAKLVKK